MLILLSLLTPIELQNAEISPSEIDRSSYVAQIIPYSSVTNEIIVALRYINFNQRTHRRELREFLNVDPVNIDWCAAFINSVLREINKSGSEIVSDAPLTAKSFLSWGVEVTEPLQGDIVIFDRGKEEWQGHVGFYYSTEYKNGAKYYNILGGNQDQSVTVQLFLAEKALSIRRYK